MGYCIMILSLLFTVLVFLFVPYKFFKNCIWSEYQGSLSLGLQSTALAITATAGLPCSMAGQAVHVSACVGELSVT